MRRDAVVASADELGCSAALGIPRGLRATKRAVRSMARIAFAAGIGLLWRDSGVIASDIGRPAAEQGG